MRRAAALLGAAVAGLACVSYEDLPPCERLYEPQRPSFECRQSDEAAAWQQRLAWEILRRSQWEYPYGVPLHVEVDDAGRVGRVCVGSPEREADWSTRDRVAASLRSLRRAPAAPACMAGTTVNLASALYEQGLPQGTDPAPLGMTPCEGSPDEYRNCPPQTRAVCAVRRDRTRRTYRNACAACREPDVIGYFDFAC